MSILFNPARVHVELSSKCTLKCPRCPRTEVHPDTLNRDFSLADFKTAFDTATLFQLEYILFCGDIGDPIYNKDFLDIIRYIKDSGCLASINIVTNGSYKSVEWWSELGGLLRSTDCVTFSVDGWDQESNEQYRVNSDFASIIMGIQALKASSACGVQWSTIIFKFNEDHMDQICNVARAAGADMFTKVESTKFGPNYEVDGVDPLMPRTVSKQIYEREIVFFGRKNSNEDKVGTISDYQGVDKHPWARCINHQKELFINVEGLLFPCPWFNSLYLENSFIEKYKDRLSIKNRSLLDVLNDPMWEELYTMFEIAPLEICRMKCVR